MHRLCCYLTESAGAEGDLVLGVDVERGRRAEVLVDEAVHAGGSGSSPPTSRIAWSCSGVVSADRSVRRIADIVSWSNAPMRLSSSARVTVTVVARPGSDTGDHCLDVDRQRLLRLRAVVSEPNERVGDQRGRRVPWS